MEKCSGKEPGFSSNVRTRVSIDHVRLPMYELIGSAGSLASSGPSEKVRRL